MSMTKSKAFLIHLGISATIVGVVCALIFFAWYPRPYFNVVGAWSVLKVLIGVDLVVGPLLTLILYKPNKPGLLFDLVVIAAIQLTALIYGTNLMYQERPYYVVFAIDRFEVVARTEIDTNTFADESLRNKPFIGPVLIMALFPEQEQLRQQLLDDVLAGKPDLDRRPEYWHPYARHSVNVIERATPLTKLADERPDARDQIEAFMRSRTDADDLIGIPIVGKKGAFWFVLKASTQHPVGVIDIDPWVVPAS